jgi:hypothetical protein
VAQGVGPEFKPQYYKKKKKKVRGGELGRRETNGENKPNQGIIYVYMEMSQ